MVKVRIDLEELDLDTLARLEEASKGRQLSPVELRSLVATFMAGDDGEPLSAEDAAAAAGRLKLRDVKGVIIQLNAALAALAETAVPKAPSATS